MVVEIGDKNDAPVHIEHLVDSLKLNVHQLTCMVSKNFLRMM
jgi:hypothetical protein